MFKLSVILMFMGGIGYEFLAVGVNILMVLAAIKLKGEIKWVNLY